MKEILKNSFYQLLVVYAVLIALISFNLFWKYTYHFEIFALIIAILGIFIISRDNLRTKKVINNKIHYFLIILALLLIITLRVIPYLDNSIPLGYDTGIYKYGIEHGLQNYDNWILRGGLEPGFLYLMKPFTWIFNSQFILTYFLIGFCVMLGIGIYLVTKEYFNKEAALISLLIYSLSLIQFKTFWYMYYKNIIGLSLALFSIYFLKRYKDAGNKKFIWLFVILGGLLGSIHRPTFYIFGLSYFFYVVFGFIKERDYRILKQNITNGILILLIAGVFYLGKFSQAVFVVLPWVAEGFLQPGQSPGTFINFFTYQFSTLTYLPFAILGLFFLIKKRYFNILFFWALITALIVYFQFFFFNRFIIHLDIMLIILSGAGFSIIIENKKKIGYLILIIMIFSSGFLAFNDSFNSKPLISANELETIKYFQNTESNSYAMSTSSIYSTWILGYSGRKTIAPGLFDYDTHTEDEWIVFWTTEDISKIKTFMNAYEKPLYIFIGQKQNNNLDKFRECFEIIYELDNNKIYKYTC